MIHGANIIWIDFVYIAKINKSLVVVFSGLDLAAFVALSLDHYHLFSCDWTIGREMCLVDTNDEAGVCQSLNVFEIRIGWRYIGEGRFRRLRGANLIFILCRVLIVCLNQPAHILCSRYRLVWLELSGGGVQNSERRQVFYRLFGVQPAYVFKRDGLRVLA